MRIAIPVILTSVLAATLFWLSQSNEPSAAEVQEFTRYFGGTAAVPPDTEVAQQPTAAPSMRNTIPDDRSELASETKAADRFVAEVIRYAADRRGQTQAQQAVSDLFQGRTDASPGFRRHVADRLVAELPGTEVAANAELFRIAVRFQHDATATAELVEMLDDFSKNYPASDLPVTAYKWVCEQLVAHKDARGAVQLARHAVKVSRPHRDVKRLEAYLRMTEQTYTLLASIGKGNPTKMAEVTPDVSQPESELTEDEFTSFLGKPLMMSGKTHEDLPFSASSIQGDWAVVHFWATWCPSCRRFTPQLKPLYDDWSSRSVKFVGVSLDDDLTALKKFASDNKLTWPHVVSSSGKSGWKSPLAQENRVKSIPVVFLVGPDGNVVEAGLKSVGDIELALRIHVSQEDVENTPRPNGR